MQKKNSTTVFLFAILKSSHISWQTCPPWIVPKLDTVQEIIKIYVMAAVAKDTEKVGHLKKKKKNNKKNKQKKPSILPETFVLDK